MAQGDKYITKQNQVLSTEQILRSLIRQDLSGKPFLKTNASLIPIEPIEGAADALIFVLNDILNSPVVDPSSVSQWNTWLSSHSSSYISNFSSVSVSVNTIELIGASGIEDFTWQQDGVVKLLDNVGSILSIGGNAFNQVNAPEKVMLSACLNIKIGAFKDCVVLHTFVAELCQNILSTSFENCLSLNKLYLSSCTNFGGTTGNDLVFDHITGKTFTLKIPTATISDGDVQSLIAVNTINLISV